MNIWVENYINARSFRPVEPTAAIRIFDPGTVKRPKGKDGDWLNGPLAPFPKELYVRVWEYTFDDVNYDLYDDEHRLSMMTNPRHTPFTANMADDLVRKFSKAKDDVSALLIHCHAGVNRSVAVAHALDECFELDAHWSGGAARFKRNYDGYVGNDFVYRLVCEAVDRL